MKKKKGGRYTPPKQKIQIKLKTQFVPWWEREAYQGSGNHVDYFFRIIDFFENGPPVNPNLVLEVKKVRWHL